LVTAFFGTRLKAAFRGYKRGRPYRPLSKLTSKSHFTCCNAARLLARIAFKFVMPGLAPGIHVLQQRSKKDVDGRDKPGHDGPNGSTELENALNAPALKQREIRAG
jgi:hypothetical protein